MEDVSSGQRTSVSSTAFDKMTILLVHTANQQVADYESWCVGVRQVFVKLC